MQSDAVNSVGCSKLIADGHIKIKQGQNIKRILPNGVEFEDGDKRDADIMCVVSRSSESH
jgi:hypothetical protein